MTSFYVSENISFEIPWEDVKSDRAKFLDDPNILARNDTSRKQLREPQYTPRSGRVVAGNKRVAQYRNTQGYKSGGGQVLQSITATPALNHSSFEELRVECYAQSQIAKGCPPSVVDPVKAPWAVIPPVYNAFLDTSDDQKETDTVLTDVTMKD
ncbi:hypothetical protein JR316_0002551 [Psilocybe cubensis]|uniref:Uncharacterized protein n=2 Tax=Psilocybe cubensis TaxID=181762 RepID=A0ACB8HCN9_PSICU|nr:hypothetical protein JR316_0002551 [Psilocybe cubensis]KAH9485641.1 hypothetical protein JR316_0002551 [Psilocybe cubensis]